MAYLIKTNAPKRRQTDNTCSHTPNPQRTIQNKEKYALVFPFFGSRESSTFPFLILLPSTRIRWIRHTNLLSRVEIFEYAMAGSGIVWTLNSDILTGDVTRSRPVLYLEYCICIQDGNLLPRISLLPALRRILCCHYFPKSPAYESESGYVSDTCSLRKGDVSPRSPFAG